MKKKIGLITLLLIPIGIAINFVGGQIIAALKLPVFIDTIGTILVGALAGPLLGAVTGGLTNLLLGITTPSFIPFAIVSIANGIVAGLLAKKGFMKTWKKVVIMSLAIWLTTMLTANPISILVFGGATGSGSSLITSFFLATGKSLFTSVFTTAIITETIDKFISCFIVFFIIKAIPNRTMLQFPYGHIYVEEAHSITNQMDEEW